MNEPLSAAVLAAFQAELPAGLSGMLEDPAARPLLEALPVAVCTIDAAGQLTYYNRAAAALWGWEPPLLEQLWCGSWRLYRPDGIPLPHAECPMALCLREARPVRGAWAFAERPDGSRIPFAPFPTPLWTEDGRLAGAVNVLIDISRQRAAEAARAVSEARFEAAQEVAPEGFLALEAVRDAAGGLRDLSIGYANPAAARLFGMDRARLEGSRLLSLRLGGEVWAAGLVESLGAVIDTGRSLVREFEHAGAGYGGRGWVRARAVKLGDGVALALEDITERRMAQDRIRHLALHDPLTGLANRRRLQEKLDEALADPRVGGVAVLRLNLDHFRNVNDALGHAVGDALLRAVTGRLNQCLRDGTLAARLGGDEFAVLMTGEDLPAEAEALARRIATVLSRRYGLGRYRASVGVTIGIAFAEAAGRNPDAAPDTLLRQADLALSRAKAEDRGRHRVYVPAMAVAAQRQHDLQAELQAALDSQALELHYQPVFDLRTDRLVGFEALLRWHHPQRGMVSPAEFIPVAEATGLIVPIGEWVLRTACAEAASWPAELKVAVNLSPAQFVGAEVAATVGQALAAAGLAPERLELEITESVLLQQSDHVADTLRHLHAMGVRLALDDFGTGYSSLSTLRGFPFDKIKIDQSFVRDAITRPDCLAIVRSVAALAADLGMTATAEGVEAPEHLAMVRGTGCGEAQGYHLGRPAPRAELGRWIGQPYPLA